MLACPQCCQALWWFDVESMVQSHNLNEFLTRDLDDTGPVYIRSPGLTVPGVLVQKQTMP
jgi:hypothetical protein